jgi:hypothetical protein
VTALRGEEKVDEAEYLSRNLRLLSELPVFPGARPLSTIRDRCMSRDAREAPVSGFFTSRSFGSLAKRVARAWSGSTRPICVAGAPTRPREYALSVDHRGDACPAP